MAERLEETCFTYVLKALEEFDVSRLSLLPAKIRSCMLAKMPLVDICRLEKTDFVSGLDMTLIWKQICDERNTSGTSFSQGRLADQNNWKRSLLTRISNILLNNERPYGYFQLMTRADKGCPWVGRDITDEQPVHKHPVDLVNYLVAIFHEKPLPVSKVGNSSDEEDDDDWKKWQRRKYGPSYVVMVRHDVILHKGIVPPADPYHRACQTKQLVPRRFAHYFSKGSSFLPDNIAITLLSRECGYFPENVIISSPKVSTFLYNTEHETSDLGFLKDYFKHVVSVTIRGDVEEELKWKVNPGAKALSHVERVWQDEPKVGRSGHPEAARSRRPLHRPFANVVTKEESMQREVPSRVLDLILSNPSHTFTDLTISIGKTSDQLLATVTPQLTTQFSGLRKLSISASGSVSPNLEKLLTITEHQQTLDSISISITEITQCFGSFGPIVKNTPDYSRPLMLSYLETCFKKPSLNILKVCLNPVTAEFVQKILVSFLATSCCSEQTLVINFKLDKTTCVVDSDVLPPYPVDDNCTRQYKSLVLQRCSIPASFASWLFSFQPLKLKKVVIKDYCYLDISVFTNLARHKSFDVESVKFSSLYLSGAVIQDFTSLLEKPSLKSVYFKNCSALNLHALADGLAVQQRMQTLSELRVSYTKFRRDEKVDDGAVRKLSSTVFSLPKLSQFSLTLLMAFSQKQLEILTAEWKKSGSVKMQALNLSFPNSSLNSSLEVELKEMATVVEIDTYEPPPPKPSLAKPPLVTTSRMSKPFQKPLAKRL